MKKNKKSVCGELFRTKSESYLFDLYDVNNVVKIPKFSIILKISSEDFVQQQTGNIFFKVLFNGAVGLINRSYLKKVPRKKNKKIDS